MEKRFQLNSPLAFILRANDEKRIGNEEGYKSYLDLIKLQSTRPAYLIDKSKFEEPWNASEGFSQREGLYRNPILILTDRENGSAGEELIMALKHHPYVSLIGENSKGVFHFGNAGFFQLPNSGINVHLSTYYNQIESGEFVEKIGFTPDWKVKGDALDWVKANFKRASSNLLLELFED